MCRRLHNYRVSLPNTCTVAEWQRSKTCSFVYRGFGALIPGTVLSVSMQENPQFPDGVPVMGLRMSGPLTSMFEEMMPCAAQSDCDGVVRGRC